MNNEIHNEAYWEAKHPVVEQLYQGRPIPGTNTMFDIDVRRFIWPDDLVMQRVVTSMGFAEQSLDARAQKVQRYVVSNIRYVSDEKLGSSEFWLFPAETLVRKAGDCEDGAVLMASLLLNALPEKDRWRVRVAAGWVLPAPTAPQGGHGYCTYCRELDNEWVVLDWCFYEDSATPVMDKPLQKNNPSYKDVWFSFNHKHAWSHVRFELGGRARKYVWSCHEHQ